MSCFCGFYRSVMCLEKDVQIKDPETALFGLRETTSYLWIGRPPGCSRSIELQRLPSSCQSSVLLLGGESSIETACQQNRHVKEKKKQLKVENKLLRRSRFHLQQKNKPEGRSDFSQTSEPEPDSDRRTRADPRRLWGPADAFPPCVTFKNKDQQNPQRQVKHTDSKLR